MRGFVVWLTGLPASGKTTIARKLEEKLQELGWDTEVLDGDELRKGLSQDLGFSKEDRLKHGRRVAYLAKMLAKHGVAVIVSLVSPYRAMRDYARNLIEKFIEVYVKCSVETCMKRDPEGPLQKSGTRRSKEFHGDIRSLRRTGKSRGSSRHGKNGSRAMCSKNFRKANRIKIYSLT